MNPPKKLIMSSQRHFYLFSVLLSFLQFLQKKELLNNAILILISGIESIKFNFNDQLMSQYHTHNEDPYGSARSPSRTERDPRQPEFQRSPQRVEGTRTQRVALESPSKYDIEFYQRKVNRLENDMTVLQDELSLTKFKLSKAQDFQRKYHVAFQQNQDLVSELDLKDQQTVKLQREIDELLRKNDQLQLEITNLQSKLEVEKRNNQNLRDRHEQYTKKASSEGKNEKASIEDSYIRQIATLKQDFASRQQNMRRKLNSLQIQIQAQNNHEKALKFKLQSIKSSKNSEVDYLRNLTTQLKQQLSQLNTSTDIRVTSIRTDLITETEQRIENVRKLASDIEQCLMNEIRNLNETLSTKNSQLQFIISADRRFMSDNEQLQNGLKQHIGRLQDKIFLVQRQAEVELFETIDRLQNQYQENLNNLNDQFDQVRRTHQEEVDKLNEEIDTLRRENNLLEIENKRVESQHKKVSVDKQEAIKMLSQKIVSLQSAKDIDLKYYTTSMKEIEQGAKAKLLDLHTAISEKNTQFEILNAQLALKNQQINSLIDQINKLRNQNREKLRSFENKNFTEQNMLNDLITSYKREAQELRRRVHELQGEISDKQAQGELKLNLMRQDLQSQKEANEMLRSRNQFLQQWSHELERDLKQQRVSNVNILQDTNVSRRQTVQVREQVRTELQAIKDKEVEQIRNIFKLEKNRLEADLLNKEHQLRQKKEENARLLAEYKKLETKVGKPSKFDRGVEQEGKCKATLNAEILLTQNIFNAINTQ